MGIRLRKGLSSTVLLAITIILMVLISLTVYNILYKTANTEEYKKSICYPIALHLQRNPTTLEESLKQLTGDNEICIIYLNRTNYYNSCSKYTIYNTLCIITYYEDNTTIIVGRGE